MNDVKREGVMRNSACGNDTLTAAALRVKRREDLVVGIGILCFITGVIILLAVLAVAAGNELGGRLQ